MRPGSEQLGSVIAFAAARVVAGMLVNVSASDPLTYVATAVFLAAIAARACVLPARRAMRVNRMRALRGE